MIKRNIIILVFALASVVGVLFSHSVFAQEEKECAGAATSVISCSSNKQTAIINVIKIVIKIMAAGVGVLAVGAVIFGAILYTTSEGSPDKLSKARTVWINTVIGLLLFAFMVAITNFFVPGGVFQ